MVEKTRARYVSVKRMAVIATAFILFASLLVMNLFRLQCLASDYYREKVYDQITTSSKLRAKRGSIYDSNMNLLAGEETTWRIFVMTADVKKATKGRNTDIERIIAAGAAQILGKDEETLCKKIKEATVNDVTLAPAADEDTYEKLLAFIKENDLTSLLLTEAQTGRTYPNGTAFAHVLGFTGSDLQGLYGLEYQYDEELAGKDGYYLYAKDAGGNALPSEYEAFVPATDGYSLVTTLDSYVQSVAEEEIERIRVNHQVNNRVSAIVMDTATGGILAMATSSPFDPNDPYTLDAVSASKLEESGLTPGSDEYNAYKKELMEVMWSNKAVSETYEPGSTFKIITVSAALALKVATMSDRFSCVGYYEVGGWHIKCHKIGGHGSNFTLAYGLQMSCNPTMMQVAERIGAADYYAFVENFGYLKKSGIDLPSEARTIFHQLENIGATELATISFGQRFKVTMINHLKAIAAVANGGYEITPHIVDKVIDADGNTVSSFDTSQKTRILEESVAREIAAVLEEGVSGNGGAKNAYVDGYKVAAKTGTSQKFDVLDANGNSYLRIGSTVAFAPSDTAGVAIIIVVDEPMCEVKYGSTVAAPYVAAVLEKILPYLGYESNAEKTQLTVGDYVGMPKNAAVNALEEQNTAYEIIGDGDTVLSQVPAAGDVFTGSLSKILLYTEKTVSETVAVPSCIGLSLYDANVLLTDSGFNIRIVGANPNVSDETLKVEAQSPAPDTVCGRGDVVTLTVLSYNDED